MENENTPVVMTPERNALHIFVINPAAGKVDSAPVLSETVKKACTEADVPFEVHVTTGKGDADAYVRACIAQYTDRPLRFYACGGDGTLCDVANAAMGASNVSIGVIPVGTGNDFTRNFENRDLFFDVTAQISGKPVDIDLLTYNGKACVNMLNVGFDCEVVVKTSEIKRKPWVPSKLAYVFGLVNRLVTLPFVKVKENGGEKKYLLFTSSNGQFCGGGFRSNPRASLRDGLADVCLIQYMSRLRFISMVGDYKKGTHLETKSANYVEYKKVSSIDFEFGKIQNICVDGEVEQTERLHIEVLPRGLSFVLPAGTDFRLDSGKETEPQTADAHTMV